MTKHICSCSSLDPKSPDRFMFQYVNAIWSCWGDSVWQAYSVIVRPATCNILYSMPTVFECIKLHIDHFGVFMECYNLAKTMSSRMFVCVCVCACRFLARITYFPYCISICLNHFTLVKVKTDSSYCTYTNDNVANVSQDALCYKCMMYI